MSYRVEFGFGAGWTKEHKTINAEFASQCVSKIFDHAAKLYGGCLLLHGRGAWYDSVAKAMIVEPAYVIVCDADARHFIWEGEIIALIKQLLLQQCVHLTVHEIASFDV